MGPPDGRGSRKKTDGKQRIPLRNFGTCGLRTLRKGSTGARENLEGPEADSGRHHARVTIAAGTSAKVLPDDTGPAGSNAMTSKAHPRTDRRNTSGSSWPLFRLKVSHQLNKGDAHRRGDSAKCVETRIAPASLDPTYVGPMKAGAFRQCLLGEFALLPQFADSLAESRAEVSHRPSSSLPRTPGTIADRL
jgi:hypothetical protein